MNTEQKLMTDEEYQELCEVIDAMPAPDPDWDVLDEKLRRRIAEYKNKKGQR